MPNLFADLKRLGLWRGYHRHVVRLEPILRAMADRGMPLSRPRHDEVRDQLAREVAALEADMQALVPDDVKTLKVYKRKPSIRLPWKPSNKGLIKYMKFRGHTVPTDYKTKKETTGELELKRLARLTDDPLYWKVLAYKKLSTVLNNHMAGWVPDADNRVHSTFYFDPATGQLSSRRPNLQNAPKHPPKDIKGLTTNPADLFRSMVEARENHILIEFDFKSFHAQTLAFEAEDKDYLRLAKLDIHSYVCAHLVRHPDAQRCIGWGDAELADFLKHIKSKHKFERDFKAKRAILGYGFGMGYKKLYEMNRESFANQSEAKRTTEMLDALFPKCKKWRDDIRAQAHAQGYLLSRHGYIRHFWEVFRFKYRAGQTIASPGDDSEAAIAFLPANDAFGEIKDRMLELEERGLLARYNLINQIHDALVFECPLALEEEARTVVPAVMSAPSKILVNSICPAGLSVEVSILRGRRWNEMVDC